MDEQSWTVDAEAPPTRLDKFLADPDRLGSRGKAFDAIARGKVFVNGDEVNAGARVLTPGDAVRVWMDRPGSGRARIRPYRAGDVDIVFEDSALLVVNKPAGILTVPLARKGDVPSVVAQLADLFRAHGKRPPQVVHRIDRDTSGLVIFAKTPDAQAHLKQQFLRREPERVYRAVVYGHPSPARGTWRDTLVWDTRALVQKATRPGDPRGKEAVSDYETIERFAETSLIEVRLVTGKRNQIRLQARLRGHTLVGEQRYVYGPDSLRPIDFHRQALHAFRLALQHPRDGRLLQFEAPLPPDMEDLLRRLRR